MNKQETYEVSRYWDESPVGSGTVRVKVTVNPEGYAPEGPTHLFLFLEWEPEDTEGQPDRWSLEWFHSLELIADSLADYLEKYCPVSREMIRTFLMILPVGLRIVFIAADNRSLERKLDEERDDALREMRKESESAKELLTRLKETVKK
jgi:hypothetical protein